MLFEVSSPLENSITWADNPVLLVGVVAMFCLLQTLGNFLLYALIVFEKYGMDAQKRTAVNQIISASCATLIFGNAVLIPGVVWRLIIGPLGKVLFNIVYYDIATAEIYTLPCPALFRSFSTLC